MIKTKIPNSEINTVIRSDNFTCWQPNCYTEGDAYDDWAFSLTQEHKPNKNPTAKGKKGFYLTDRHKLLKKLVGVWFESFGEFWYWRKKQEGIKGTVKMRLRSSWSPEYYNFQGDAAMVSVSVNQTAYHWLRRFNKKHSDAFHDFLTYAHGPRPGWSPYEPYTYGDWLDIYAKPRHKRFHLALTRGYDFVLFGQKNGEFSEEIANTLRKEFKEFWENYYAESLHEIEKCVKFNPDPHFDLTKW